MLPAQSVQEENSLMMYKLLLWIFCGFGMDPRHPPSRKYFAILVVTVAFMVSLPVLSGLPFTLSNTFGFLILFSNACSAVSFVGFVGVNILHRQRYQSNLQGLIREEGQLVKINAGSSSFFKIDRVIFFTVSTWYCVVCVFYLFKINSFLNWSRLAFSFLANLPLMQHLLLVDFLDGEFSSLNEHLRQLKKMSNEPLPSITSQLEEIFRNHSTLSDRVTEINTHYFVYNFFSFISKMVTVIFSIYVYLLYVDGKDIVELEALMVVLTSDVAVFVMQAVLCHACAKKANTTVLLAHALLNPHSPLSLWQQVGDFSRLYVDSRVAFSVGNLFNQDRPLVTKAAVACFSYLVVAVQLQSVEFFDNPDTDSIFNTTVMNN